MRLSRRVSCEENYTSPVWLNPDAPASSSTPPPDLGNPPVITSGLPPNGSIGNPYSFTVTATGDTPIFFSASGLPPGMSLDPVTGVLSGTPTTIGTYSGSFTATNGVMPDDTQDWVIEIKEAPVITSPEPPGGNEGAPYTYTVTATGSPTIVFSATGLPTGLSIDGGSGVISGTPSASGTFNTVIRADNGVPPADEQVFVFTIGAPLILTEDGDSIGIPTGLLARYTPPSAKISELGALTGEPTLDDLFVEQRPSDDAVASATVAQLFGAATSLPLALPALLDDSLVVPAVVGAATRASPAAPDGVDFGASLDQSAVPAMGTTWSFSVAIAYPSANGFDPFMSGGATTSTGFPLAFSVGGKVMTMTRDWDLSFLGKWNFEFARMFFGIIDGPCTVFSASDAPSQSYAGIQFSASRGDTEPRFVSGIAGAQTFANLTHPEKVMNHVVRSFSMSFRTADARLRFYVGGELVGITPVGFAWPTSVFGFRPYVMVRHQTGTVNSYLYVAKVEARAPFPAAYL